MVEVTAFLFSFKIEVICLSGDLLSKVIGTSVLLQGSSTHTYTLFMISLKSQQVLNPLAAYFEDMSCIGENYIRREETVNTTNE